MIISGIPLVCAVVSGLANTVVAVTVKGAQHYDCRPSRFGALAMTAAGAISLVVALTQPGSWWDWHLWTLGIVLGLLCYGTVTATVLANHYGPPSLPWAMANLGLIVPIGLAAVFLGEALRWTDALCLIVFGGMLLAFVRGTARAGDVRADRRLTLILLLAMVLLVNGTLMFGFKLNSFLPAGVNLSALSPIMYAAGASLSWLDEWRRPRQQFRWDQIAWGVGMGLGNGTAVLLLLVAMQLPASVAFPVIQGVSFLGGIVATALIFRERLNPWKSLGIGLGLAVILLAVWR